MKTFNISVMRKNSGQIVLGLILIMTVALAIGLSIVQKSLVDVSTSTKVEESSRAFSAAEGGVEKALQGDNTGVNFSDNNSSATIIDSGLIPAIPQSPNKQDPLEYPALAKEEVAHFWLADLTSNIPSSPPTCGPSIRCYYTQSTLDVYWGDPKSSDLAALELSVIYFDNTSSTYQAKKIYLDQAGANRNLSNFDTSANCNGTWQLPFNKYQCKYTLTSLPAGLVILRGRLLYNTKTSQPIAIQANPNCSNPGCYIPPQARILVSNGVSGETQRRIRVFQIQKVVPPYFDYAIFSAGDLRK